MHFWSGFLILMLILGLDEYGHWVGTVGLYLFSCVKICVFFSCFLLDGLMEYLERAFV
jgi:hypothetical protein